MRTGWISAGVMDNRSFVPDKIVPDRIALAQVIVPARAIAQQTVRLTAEVRERIEARQVIAPTLEIARAREIELGRLQAERGAAVETVLSGTSLPDERLMCRRRADGRALPVREWRVRASPGAEEAAAAG